MQYLERLAARLQPATPGEASVPRVRARPDGPEPVEVDSWGPALPSPTGARPSRPPERPAMQPARPELVGESPIAPPPSPVRSEPVGAESSPPLHREPIAPRPQPAAMPRAISPPPLAPAHGTSSSTLDPRVEQRPPMAPTRSRPGSPPLIAGAPPREPPVAQEAITTRRMQLPRARRDEGRPEPVRGLADLLARIAPSEAPPDAPEPTTVVIPIQPAPEPAVARPRVDPPAPRPTVTIGRLVVEVAEPSPARPAPPAPRTQRRGVRRTTHVPSLLRFGLGQH